MQGYRDGITAEQVAGHSQVLAQEVLNLTQQIGELRLAVNALQGRIEGLEEPDVETVFQDDWDEKVNRYLYEFQQRIEKLEKAGRWVNIVTPEEHAEKLKERRARFVGSIDGLPYTVTATEYIDGAEGC